VRTIYLWIERDEQQAKVWHSVQDIHDRPRVRVGWHLIVSRLGEVRAVRDHKELLEVSE
jgi:hypothetical protein